MFKNIFAILVALIPFTLLGQTPNSKEINNQIQSWFSINTITKFSDRWGIVADFHIRRDDFIKDPSFYFLRGGITYIPNSLISITAGYAHMWLAPTNPDWSTYADENRIYQQFQMNTKIGTVGVLQRLRNEQRWQEKIENDQVMDEIRFTNRIRYLASFNIPVSKNNKAPALILSDEILVHFGKEVVYNTFDQNRFFVGIKKNINPKFSYDFGYMNVIQQKYSGYQYDINHTLRLFFYLNTAIKSQTPQIQPTSGDE